MIITLVIFLGFFAFAHAQVPNTKLILNFHLLHEETSKDSNTDTYDIKVVDRQVEYHWKHGGYPDNDSKDLKYALTDKEYGNVIDYIVSNKMQKNIKERKPVGEIGRSIDLKVTISLNGKKTVAEISGMTSIWDSRSKKETNIDNLDYLDRADGLMRVITERIEHL